ncbi:hypothetical protein JNB62_05345 [Microbacterium jejuense]|uniref:Uncharacterized protein n=1 Tax=Microbacterium jejuense TaxID=1263637 RepID=A0ABS7HKZ4_9MICO|nr:hypothetical protein [Microbacterium jejuense]MBW9093100.1 hypothetical protein [Microbacterium jejuense]
MTITSKGYEGSVDYATWALVASHAGAEYGVVGLPSFALSAGPGDREVRVAAGRAVGQGIVDDSDAVTSLVGTPVTAGNRWDLVCLRRDWLTGTSTLVLLPGLASGDKVIPIAQMERDPGVTDDQPIGLVRFAAGQSAAQEFEDLRVWYGSGGTAAKSLLVRQFLDRIGSRVWIQGITWVRGFASDGTDRWVPDSVYVGTTAPPYADNLLWVRP